MPDLRIVSLLPSNTEIACALGLGAKLVGRSHECDYPQDVAELPVCTRANIADGASREIDDRVRELVAKALSIYEVDADLLRELAPTAILTQDQCEVCAASLSEVEDALEKWIGTPPQVVSLSPATLGDVWGDIVRVGDALGAGDRARALSRALSDRVTEIAEKVGALDRRPSVACIEWLDPLMSAGNWMPELVKLAGGRNLFGHTGERSPWIEWEELRKADPDEILLMPCGFDIARTRLELPALAGLPGFAELRAVREGRVHLTDGNAYFNRPGPRLVDSLEILVEILHPDAFPFGHEGGGWQRVRL